MSSYPICHSLSPASPQVQTQSPHSSPTSQSNASTAYQSLSPTLRSVLQPLVHRLAGMQIPASPGATQEL